MNIFDKNRPRNKLEFIELCTEMKGYFPCHIMMRNMIYNNAFYKFSGQHDINVKDMKQKEKDAISILTKCNDCIGFENCYYTHENDINLPPEYVLLKCFCCEHGRAEKEREELSKSHRIGEFKRLNKIYLKNDSGFVYFIKSEISGNIKIGKTNHLSGRFSSIKCCDPSAILLFAIKTENRHSLERRLHNFFYEKREAGEWFLLSEKDVDYIKHKYEKFIVTL